MTIEVKAATAARFDDVAITRSVRRRIPTLHLKVDDIDDFYGAVLANGFTPLTEPRKQHSSAAREFLMDDPDGNKLAFFAKK